MPVIDPRKSGWLGEALLNSVSLSDQTPAENDVTFDSPFSTFEAPPPPVEEILARVAEESCQETRSEEDERSYLVEDDETEAELARIRARMTSRRNYRQRQRYERKGPNVRVLRGDGRPQTPEQMVRDLEEPVRQRMGLMWEALSEAERRILAEQAGLSSLVDPPKKKAEPAPPVLDSRPRRKIDF